jgi:hypothetical protein
MSGLGLALPTKALRRVVGRFKHYGGPSPTAQPGEHLRRLPLYCA